MQADTSAGLGRRLGDFNGKGRAENRVDADLHAHPYEPGAESSPAR